MQSTLDDVASNICHACLSCMASDDVASMSCPALDGGVLQVRAMAAAAKKKDKGSGKGKKKRGANKGSVGPGGAGGGGRSRYGPAGSSGSFKDADGAVVKPMREVGPGSYWCCDCSPRQGMPSTQQNEGSKCASTTWWAIFAQAKGVATQACVARRGGVGTYYIA